VKIPADVGGMSRWAVVGLGQFARGRLLPALSRAANTRLAGVYTRNPEVRRAVADEYGIRAYESYAAVLADPQVQIVAIVTPHDLHAEQTIQAAAARKHVFVEKPMALSVPDAVKMRRACEAAGVRLYVGFHLRFHEAHQQARDAVRSGRLGDLVCISAKWTAYREPDTGWRLDPSLSGGALLTARGVHLLDLIRFVSGAEFATIAAESDGFRTEHPADDVTAALGRLSSGAIAHVLCSRLVRGSDDTLEVSGSRGRLVCRGVLSNDNESSLVLTNGSSETVRTFPKIDMLGAEFGHVSAAVAVAAFGEEMAATATDGVRVTVVTSALVESIRNQRVMPLAYSV
jgi:predicted dehydrogenase